MHVQIALPNGFVQALTIPARSAGIRWTTDATSQAFRLGFSLCCASSGLVGVKELFCVVMLRKSKILGMPLVTGYMFRLMNFLN